MVVGKCEVCGKEARLDEHHITPFWDDVIKVCKSCHVKLEQMIKNFLIYGDLYPNNKRAYASYHGKYRAQKCLRLTKEIVMVVRFNKKTETISLCFFASNNGDFSKFLHSVCLGESNEATS